MKCQELKQRMDERENDTKVLDEWRREIKKNQKKLEQLKQRDYDTVTDMLNAFKRMADQFDKVFDHIGRCPKAVYCASENSQYSDLFHLGKIQSLACDFKIVLLSELRDHFKLSLHFHVELGSRRLSVRGDTDEVTDYLTQESPVKPRQQFSSLHKFTLLLKYLGSDKDAIQIMYGRSKTAGGVRAGRTPLG
ncbi:hypothetical protein CHU98_g3523 [Xylaria longipes]|nr:hypothetical protein CHU98_g3523 [Xylaria longipes]